MATRARMLTAPPASQPATAPTGQPAEPAATRVAKKPAKHRPSKEPSTADLAAMALANNPRITLDEIAAAIERAPRTARRYMPKANGHQLTGPSPRKRGGAAPVCRP